MKNFLAVFEQLVTHEFLYKLLLNGIGAMTAESFNDHCIIRYYANTFLSFTFNFSVFLFKTENFFIWLFNSVEEKLFVNNKMIWM